MTYIISSVGVRGMSKYTLTIEGDFDKGDCYSCPLSLIEYGLFRDDDPHCMAGEESSNCPLEEATVAKSATVEGEWIMETRYTYMPIEYKEGMLVEHPYTMYICSKCGREELKAELYCHCGAKMKGCK